MLCKSKGAQQSLGGKVHPGRRAHQLHRKRNKNKEKKDINEAKWQQAGDIFQALLLMKSAKIPHVANASLMALFGVENAYLFLREALHCYFRKKLKVWQ